MIAVTDLQGKRRYINAELIEHVEANPETQIVLTTGRRHYVRETPAEVAERVLEYRRACLHPPPGGRAEQKPAAAGAEGGSDNGTDGR